MITGWVKKFSQHYFRAPCLPVRVIICKNDGALSIKSSRANSVKSDVKYKYISKNTHSNDYAIKWKPIQRYWPFVRGIHRSTMSSPDREAGDLRHHYTHHDVTVMVDENIQTCHNVSEFYWYNRFIFNKGKDENISYSWTYQHSWIYITLI